MRSSMLVCCCSRIVRVLVRSPNNFSYNYLGSKIGGMVSRGSFGSKAYSTALLMLPSSFGSGAMKAYSVAEEKVISINKEAEGVCLEESTVVGSSSQGWVALFNWNSYEGDLYLWHPLLGRRVKLPVLSSLPDAYSPPPMVYDMFRIQPRVKKLIISCSPDPDDKEEECCAMMICGEVGMGYCRSCCHSDKWTPPVSFGGEIDPYYYLDIVYSRFHKLFFCITERNELEAWDLLSSTSPSPVSVVRLKYEDDNELDEDKLESTDEEDLDDDKVVPSMAKYLVFHEDSDSGQLLLVTRHIYKTKTIGFDVHRVNRDNGKLRYLKSLGGLSIFVGNSHSVALKSPQLNPNSIYFTDSDSSVYYPKFDDGSFAQDMGVFDYENTTFSPCYYNPPYTHLSTITPPPFWYFT